MFVDNCSSPLPSSPVSTASCALPVSPVNPFCSYVIPAVNVSIVRSPYSGSTCTITVYFTLSPGITAGTHHCTWSVPGLYVPVGLLNGSYIDGRSTSTNRFDAAVELLFVSFTVSVTACPGYARIGWALIDTTRSPHGVAVHVGVGVGVGLGVKVEVHVKVAVGLGVKVNVPVGLKVQVAVKVHVGVALSVHVGVGVGLHVCVNVEDGEAVPV